MQVRYPHRAALIEQAEDPQTDRIGDRAKCVRQDFGIGLGELAAGAERGVEGGHSAPPGMSAGSGQSPPSGASSTSSPSRTSPCGASVPGGMPGSAMTRWTSAAARAISLRYSADVGTHL